MHFFNFTYPKNNYKIQACQEAHCLPLLKMFTDTQLFPAGFLILYDGPERTSNTDNSKSLLLRAFFRFITVTRIMDM